MRLPFIGKDGKTVLVERVIIDWQPTFELAEFSLFDYLLQRELAGEDTPALLTLYLHTHGGSESAQSADWVNPFKGLFDPQIVMFGTPRRGHSIFHSVQQLTELGITDLDIDG